MADHVVTALKQLAQVFLNQANGKPSADDLYLTKTGEVHHTIDKARAATNGLSTFNHIAVRKVWDQQQGSLVDALDELKELSESQSNTNEPADEIDDGWDELGLEAPSKLSPDELERLRKVGCGPGFNQYKHKSLNRISRSNQSSSFPSSFTNTSLNACFLHHLTRCPSNLISIPCSIDWPTIRPRFLLRLMTLLPPCTRLKMPKK